MKLFLASILFISVGLSSPLPQSSCGCRPATADDTTRWGGNEEIIFKEEKIRKRLSGTLSYPNEDAAGDAFVEVYTHPEHLFLKFPENHQAKKKQRRIAACVTGEDGKFCFGFIKPGKYELRVSMGSGFNVIHLYVEVDPYGNESSDEEINVVLSLGG